MRVIIAGGRKFNDYALLCSNMDHLLQHINPSTIIILSGKAPGADTLGERYAHERNYQIEAHPAIWNRQPDGSFDKGAGYRRNAEMAEVASACVCFWDQKSVGTKHMINLAESKGIPVRVINY